MTLKLLIVNGLTLIRVFGTILLIPIYKNYGGVYAGLFSLLCYLTDSIDGILARKWKASTFFGALFDGFSDKLFTIINFIVLYLITPYSLIPILFEVGVVIIQLFKYNKNYNIKSNFIGKLKVWILAICLVFTFIVSDINSIMFLSDNIKEYINNIPNNIKYFWLLFPAILIEALTIIIYILEVFKKNNRVEPVKKIKKKKEDRKYNNWLDYFKNVWLSPEFYNQHKNESNLKELRQDIR
mgnify:CR=1 FL=1